MNLEYVVYLTHYQGNLLPPFYIGSTIKLKILKGYNGTVTSKKYKSIWNQERRDNPHLFKTEVLSYHATDTEARSREESLQRFYDAPNNPAFINLSLANKKFGGTGSNSPPFGTHPTSDLIQRRMAHCKGNTYAKGSVKSPELRQQISEKLKGRPSHRKGKHLPEDHKAKIRESMLGKKRSPYKPRKLPLKKRACVKRGPYKKKI
jgi:hypothetical protein